MDCYKVRFSRVATKGLRGIDKKWIPKIISAIQDLEKNPRPLGCKKLVGSDCSYRIRIGDYRVLYDVTDNILLVLVVTIGHRRDVYR